MKEDFPGGAVVKNLPADGSRDCHTEWSKSEREKQIAYINT